MKRRRRSGFRFLGFLALADVLFAVSAGLLLLNPIRFDPPPPPLKPRQSTPLNPPTEAARPHRAASAIDAELTEIERLLDELEASIPTVEERLRDAVGKDRP